MIETQPLRIIILMPLRDDWRSASQLIQWIDQTDQLRKFIFEIFLVDDASLQKHEPETFQSAFSIVRAIRVLRLRRNLGHQRAIAIGLGYIQEHFKCDAILVMDSDGEDTVDGVVKLLNAYVQNDATKAVFAKRTRRSESLVFRVFYHLYRAMHYALTGISVRVGNFSILPAEYLNTLVVMSELWNHYAAAVFQSRLPFKMIPIPRGTRIAGRSTMNFAALVSHGLSAMSVFGEVVGVRLLIGSLLGCFLAALGIVAVIVVRFFTNLAIPGWATYATGTLLIIIILFIAIAASFTFFMLSTRSMLGFVPSRDYVLFADDVVTIYSNE